MRRTAVKVITFIGGLFFLLEFLLPAKAPWWLGGFSNPLTPARDVATNFVIVVGTMAFLLGPINLVRRHAGIILRKRKGLAESAVFLVCLVIAVIAGFLRGADESETTRNAFNVVYDALLHGVGTAFFASSMGLLAFYLVSAAHRSFRVNTLGAGLMMTSALIVMLGQVPLGDWLTSGLAEPFQLRSITEWIMTVPNVGVQRAVFMGACGGAFAAGLRLWLSLGTKTK